MDPTARNEWTNLVHDGLNGFGSHFRARLMRLLPKVRKEYPELGQVLGEAVHALAPVTKELHREGFAGSAPSDDDTGLSLVAIESDPNLPNEPVWPTEVASPLGELVEQWRQADALHAANLHPARTVLLSGPPGTGKTLAARWLAREIQRPLVALNLASVMNSFLGRTGQNLAQVLDYGRNTECVLLLDEFDALAKRRDDAQDVGELKRVVNVLLQAVDEWPSTSLLVAATNHPELLDRAMFRRFDLVVEFPAVTRAQAESALRQLLVPSDMRHKMARGLAGCPLSDAYRLVRQARVDMVLRRSSFEHALAAAWARHLAQAHADPRLAQIRMLHEEGISNREIGKRLGIHHTTVSRTLKREED
jgi:Cdc6-like AAA superfamily ATPase